MTDVSSTGEADATIVLSSGSAKSVAAARAKRSAPSSRAMEIAAPTIGTDLPCDDFSPVGRPEVDTDSAVQRSVGAPAKLIPGPLGSAHRWINRPYGALQRSSCPWQLSGVALPFAWFGFAGEREHELSVSSEMGPDRHGACSGPQRQCRSTSGRPLTARVCQHNNHRPIKPSQDLTNSNWSR